MVNRSSRVQLLLSRQQAKRGGASHDKLQGEALAACLCLLEDPEPRVRLAVSECMRLLAEQQGAAVWLKSRDAVLGSISVCWVLPMPPPCLIKNPLLHLQCQTERQVITQAFALSVATPGPGSTGAGVIPYERTFRPVSRDTKAHITCAGSRCNPARGQPNVSQCTSTRQQDASQASRCWWQPSSSTRGCGQQHASTAAFFGTEGQNRHPDGFWRYRAQPLNKGISSGEAGSDAHCCTAAKLV